MVAGLDNLLAVGQWPLPGGGKQLLMLQLPVPGDTAPYLVSSTRAFLWVQKAPNGTVRCATRTMPDGGLGALWWEIVAACHAEGTKLEWGQTAPCTRAGIKRVIKHVQRYNEGEKLTLMVGHDTPHTLLNNKAMPKVHQGCKVIVVSWLQGETVVCVPTDRLLIGNMLLLGDDKWSALLHNASRTIGIASGELC